MYPSTLFTTALVAGTAVLAQSPAGFIPSSTNELGVAYNGTAIIPGILLPTPDVSNDPVISSNNSHPSTYMVFMLDLNIDDVDVNTTNYASLTPGLNANQTTRLHWWGVNYTQATNGTFINTTDAVAPYTGPHVPEGDGVHTYGFFFFDSANYTFPQDALDGTYYDDDTAARFNFSLVGIANEIGDPVMANYFTSTYLNDTDGLALPPAAAFEWLRV